MATRKVSSWAWAFTHALFYTLPFLFLTTDWRALLVIGGTHAVIDRLRIARRWCEFYGVGFPGVWDAALRFWNRCCWSPLCTTSHIDLEPSFDAPPPFLGVWLVIIVDNTLHLCINEAALYVASR
jgi:hypothetical protein